MSEKRLVMTITTKPKERHRAAIIGGHARIIDLGAAI